VYASIGVNLASKGRRVKGEGRRKCPKRLKKMDKN
jgi:hypothetical protein